MAANSLEFVFDFFWRKNQPFTIYAGDAKRSPNFFFYSRSHLDVGSLRQTQFSSSQFCHGLPSISASVFLFFFSQVVPSPESFFRRILGLVSIRGQTTSVLLSCTSLLCSLLSVSSWCHRFWHGLLVCGHKPIFCTSSFLSSFFTCELVTGTVSIQGLSQACVIALWQRLFAKWERHFQFSNNAIFDVK